MEGNLSFPWVRVLSPFVITHFKFQTFCNIIFHHKTYANAGKVFRYLVTRVQQLFLLFSYGVLLQLVSRSLMHYQCLCFIF